MQTKRVGVRSDYREREEEESLCGSAPGSARCNSGHLHAGWFPGSGRYMLPNEVCRTLLLNKELGRLCGGDYIEYALWCREYVRVFRGSSVVMEFCAALGNWWIDRVVYLETLRNRRVTSE